METPVDVLGEALSRNWIDRPAIAVRAEMRQVESTKCDGTGPSESRPLPATEARRLLERAAQLDRALTGSRGDLDAARRRAASLSRERQSLTRSINEDQARLDGARRMVAELDRPLVRRRHSIDLDGARCQLDWVPRAIKRDEAKLAELEIEERKAAERLGEAVALDSSRPQLVAERSVVRSRLDQDARLRGEHPGVELAPVIIERLGPRPANGAAAALWGDAVGRLGQHHAAFDHDGATLLGRQPGIVGDDAYASSHRAAARAVERFDRALGREMEIEPPHTSLGLSL